MNVSIIGGGIGGLCAAIALQQLGIQATVYENTPELRPVGAGVGLAANAIQGLQRLGVADEVVARGKQLTGLVMFDGQGRVISDMDTRPLSRKYGINNFVVHRADLHEVLHRHLLPGTLLLNKRCTSINQDQEQVTASFTDGTTATADLLIAADGINSVVRRQLVPQSQPRYAGYTCWRAVIHNPGVEINGSISAETWAPQGRVGMAPLPKNRIYWYACINAPENDKRMQAMGPQDLARHFAGVHPPVPAVLAAARAEEILWNDIYDLKPLKQFAYGRVLLLGDAAHATTPNMGQGACQAIEDAVVLGQCLGREPSIAEALAKYEKRRLARTAKVIRLSRTLGAVAQWQQPFLAKVRDQLFRLMPQQVEQSQMEWLYRVDF